MLRGIIIGYGLLYLIGAAVLLFVVHATLWLVVYLAVNGVILVSAVLLERQRYRMRVDQTQGDFQRTFERFVDPTTERLMEVFLARSLLSACEAELVSLIREVEEAVDVPIRGVISDGQRSLRNAVQTVLPDIPHQLCHFHYLQEAAKPVYEADRHAKKKLKKHLRGVRPIERAIEQRSDAEAEAICGYCLAVRSDLTDDGRPPLAAPGLKLHARISAIVASLTRISEKWACRVS